MDVGEKIIAKYTNKSRNYETYFEFFCWSIIKINFSKDRNICSKFALEREMSLFQIFQCFYEAEKIMAISTNILKFITILQFSQMQLIFEINISKE